MAFELDENVPGRDINIRKSKPQGRSTPTTVPGSWLLFLLLLLIALSVILGRNSPQAPGWSVLAYRALLIVGPLALVIVGLAAWVIIRGGLFTWMRMANAPAKALARGDATGADRAFAAALARAQRFPPHDYRRGRMLIVLADYLKHRGQSSEAIALYEQAVEILEPQWKSSPWDYFAALNNLSVYLIDLENYADAQRFLEKLLVLTLVWTKGGIKDAAPTSQVVDLVLRLNLVVLFVRMEELTLAADHLQEADALFRKQKRPEKSLADWYRGVRALLLHAQGHAGLAADELAKVRDPDNLMCLSVRAKMSMARGDFAQAEQLLQKHLSRRASGGSTHRPDVREDMRDLAECLFGLGKFDEAFSTLEEVRAITRDFALPSSLAWRRALAEWLRRAQELGRIADAAWLDAELRTESNVPEHGIAIAPSLRIHPPVP